MTLNLIPEEEEKRILFFPKTIKTVVIAMVVGGISISILGFRFVANKGQVYALQNEKKSLDVELISLDEVRSSYQYYTSSKSKDLLSNRTVFSKFYNNIQAATPSTVWLNNVSLSENDNLTIDGKTTGRSGDEKAEYTEISKYTSSLKKAGFIDPKIQSASIDQKTKVVTFRIDTKITRAMISE
ncbi:TPA: hypothetical protein DDW69_03780 [candidate division CPR2 bacterium]|uniref:Fimbrial assembly family protein n=1 Tax=candidate division CPR2 bacterium GW2011_GWC1_41_48 TaxID=1618344 RepID=A0A0G0W7J9_UNCC2|nr:MAG: hypothetical protein UT47_C0003G0050 [candidate division CPR2 bacterium GW2011_GWC2_39_35]KKR28823.1 MAG: hypothetical protein UT59_C0018G0002 [candidate division CPR2 bacterium GW2011_GWD1_39_7]KKR29334.1 MAG: hypothetical protein UT60_C0003G0011 [candidate division CPR2 bacterium GW2011_GWD2_39_7]KKS08989.1 MAG: hypothetical protein UU65_C0003G0044 [candidate division CPR2 bacterium GW2011_GWC1_41_48]OGB61432.1 MAG: hypothetical protein A2Y27_03730 [candidate division CPR2 bacterium G